MRAVTAIAILTLPFATQAEVTLDGSLSGAAGDAISAGNGFTYDIPDSVGLTQGANLFHSFQEFNIGAGETANFSGAASINNIITRVTGGNSSTISGALSSSITNASFWFINPNGVIITEGASFDFGGSIHMGAANSLIFSDGEYSAENTNTPSNLSFDPLAFGFIGENNLGTLSLQSPNLTLNSNQSFTGFGSGVLLDDATVASPAGSIRFLAAGQQSAEVPVSDWSGVDVNNAGQVVLINDAEINVDGLDAGNINLSGESIQVNDALLTSTISNNGINLDDTTAHAIRLHAEDIAISNTSTIQSLVLGADIGADVELIATNQISISDQFSTVSVNALGSLGQSGDLTISAPTILITENATVSGGANSAATPPSFTISGDNITISNNANLSLDTAGEAIGQKLSLSAAQITITDEAAITADAFGSSTGAEIEIRGGELIIANNANLTAQTTDGGGAGIDIDLTESLTLNNGALIGTESFGSGPGANINIAAKNLNMREGGQIDASALNQGRGGDINISIKNNINLVGTSEGAQTEISATSGDVDREALISINQGYGEGNGGTITLVANTLSLSENASITASANRISTDFLNVGNAGNIQLGSQTQPMDNITLESGAQIATNAPFSQGGNIDIFAQTYIGITDSTISAFANGSNRSDDGGDIFIDPKLLYLNNALITANGNAGNGGDITLIADNIVRDGRTLITAQSSLGVDGTENIEGVTNGVTGVAFDAVSFWNVAELIDNPCKLNAASAGLSEPDLSNHSLIMSQSGEHLRQQVPGTYSSATYAASATYQSSASYTPANNTPSEYTTNSSGLDDALFLAMAPCSF